MNYHEKKSKKIKRYKELAKKAREKGQEHRESSNKITDMIPTGQPILVGHHSEKKHRRDLQRSDNHMRKNLDYQKKAEYYEDKAKASENNKSISSDDPEAITKLEEKLKNMEIKREKIKQYNKTAKKESKEKVDGYVLTNLNANIRATKKRIEKIKNIRARETKKEIINGITIVENVEENRTQIFFPNIPSLEIRQKLKSHGFRWSKFNGCWQAFLSSQSIYWAKEICSNQIT